MISIHFNYLRAVVTCYFYDPGRLYQKNDHIGRMWLCHLWQRPLVAVVIITAAKEEVYERLLLIRCEDGVSIFVMWVYSVSLFPVSFWDSLSCHSCPPPHPGVLFPVSLRRSSCFLPSRSSIFWFVLCFVCFSFLFGSLWIGSCLLLSLLSY